MIKKWGLSGFLALALVAGMVSTASAEVLHRTLTLGSGAGQFQTTGFDVGDTLMLTLVNPMPRPLIFETTDNLGADKLWQIPANSSVTVNLTYTQPFASNVDYIVREVGGINAPVLARGTFIEVERPASYQLMDTQQQPAAYPSPAVCPVRPTGSTPGERPVGYPVRGYW